MPCRTQRGTRARASQKAVTRVTWARVSKLAKNLAASWSVIQPSDALRATAIQIVDRYDLRAAASFQLSAALEWCEYAPQRRVFLTDLKLRDAALLSGFDAKQV
jgi:hypothetical protein